MHFAEGLLGDCPDLAGAVPVAAVEAAPQLAEEQEDDFCCIPSTLKKNPGRKTWKRMHRSLSRHDRRLIRLYGYGW